MYSSHSGTPVFGLVESDLTVSALAGAAVVVVEVVVVVFVVLAGLLETVFLEPPPQPNEIKAKHVSAVSTIKDLIVIKTNFLTNIFSPNHSKLFEAKIKNIFKMV